MIRRVQRRGPQSAIMRPEEARPGRADSYQRLCPADKKNGKVKCEVNRRGEEPERINPAILPSASGELLPTKTYHGSRVTGHLFGSSPRRVWHANPRSSTLWLDGSLFARQGISPMPV